MGGARVILATGPDSKSISDRVDGLAPGGKLVVVGAVPEPLSVSPLKILMSRRVIQDGPRAWRGIRRWAGVSAR
jgi:D-arabinose 1-dehydrogenase-like Zn-dependent alcohol dehydrogenase